MEHIDIIVNVANMLSHDDKIAAIKHLEKDYKHNYIQYDVRSMTYFEKLKIYINDGFIDRYTGKKLIFPNVLRILSIELGDAFPFHPNWKMSDCHIAYWEMIPTYDHIIPIARGGKDESSNIVTTSQMINSAKSGFLIEEIGLKILPPGKISEWDGMIHWYKGYVKEHPNILKEQALTPWNNALEKCFQEKIIE